jgi:hypothetical protein
MFAPVSRVDQSYVDPDSLYFAPDASVDQMCRTKLSADIRGDLVALSIGKCGHA